MKKKRFLIIVIALVAVIVVAGVVYKKGFANKGTSLSKEQLEKQQSVSEEVKDETSTPPKMIRKAPDFTMVDGDGKEVKLSEYIGNGKPVVLNFWASWCGPCKIEMPEFDEAYGEISDEVDFVMVNQTDGGQETMETAKAYIEENKFTLPFLFDTKYEGAMTYNITGLPTTFFIDKYGNVVGYIDGMIDREVLDYGIDMAKKQGEELDKEEDNKNIETDEKSEK